MRSGRTPSPWQRCALALEAQGGPEKKEYHQRLCIRDFLTISRSPFTGGNKNRKKVCDRTCLCIKNEWTLALGSTPSRYPRTLP